MINMQEGVKPRKYNTYNSELSFVSNWKKYTMFKSWIGVEDTRTGGYEKDNIGNGLSTIYRDKLIGNCN